MRDERDILYFSEEPLFVFAVQRWLLENMLNPRRELLISLVSQSLSQATNNTSQIGLSIHRKCKNKK